MTARRWLILPAALALGLTLGFGVFVREAWRPASLPPRADGIVVLTGGADRVAVGLRLLEQGAADRLLVSGVGRTASFADLAHRAGAALTLAPAVTLGRIAETTHGNAAETAAWARTNHIASLIVVTAGYHMPRALAELRASLPGIPLTPIPVQPPGMRDAASAATWRLLAGEYAKFLAVELGLADIAEMVDSRASPVPGTTHAECCR